MRLKRELLISSCYKKREMENSTCIKSYGILYTLKCERFKRVYQSGNKSKRVFKSRNKKNVRER